jgi:hypothetical protein
MVVAAEVFHYFIREDTAIYIKKHEKVQHMTQPKS